MAAVLDSFLSLALAALCWLTGGVRVAKGRPFEVTLIRSPCCTILRYFNKLALSSLMLTLFIFNARAITYNNYVQA